MPDELRIYLEGVREGWQDPYWWADHPFLQAAIVCGVAGMIGLMFKAAELQLETLMRSPSA